MNIKIQTAILLLGSSVWYLVSTATPVNAQQVSLSVSPPVVEILLRPNQALSQTFVLKTQGSNLDITPELHLARPSDSVGHMTIDPSPLPAGLPLTIKITGSNDSPTLTFEAMNTDVTQDIYLALVFRADSASQLDPRTTLTTPAISALILVTITPTGMLPINLEIKDFSPPIFHDSWIPLILSPILTNKASTMIRPEGIYEVIAPSGKIIFTLPLYPNLVLGNSSRLLTSNISNLSSNITWQPTWSNLGPYRLRLTINTQGGTKLSEIEKVVWILPLRFLIITTLLVLFSLIILLKLKKHRSPQSSA